MKKVARHITTVQRNPFLAANAAQGVGLSLLASVCVSVPRSTFSQVCTTKLSFGQEGTSGDKRGQVESREVKGVLAGLRGQGRVRG